MEESKGVSSVAMSPTAKGIIIWEKCPRDKVRDVTLGEMGSKGKEAMPLPEAKKKAKFKPSEMAIMEVTRPVAPREGTLANPVVALGLKVTMLKSATANSSRS